MNNAREPMIFNIQHLCLHDGPGIRTNVFFQGCPLRCLWCANPESQLARPQVLYNVEKCTLCGRCAAVCPRGAISVTGGALVTDRELCDGCGGCAEECPNSARTLSGRRTTADEVLAEVAEDRLFYGSDGGVTLTGGEPTMQTPFALEILRGAKERGVTTAMETCGFTPSENIRALAPFVDTFLYDVKAVDSELHRKCTGVDNDLILRNLRIISGEFPNCDIWLRTPVVPGYNDSTENLTALGELAAGLAGCSQVHLLPYHNLGEGKRVQLGRDAFPGETPSAERMEELRGIVRAAAGSRVAIK